MYNNVIDWLMSSNDIDYKDIVKQIAHKHPEILLHIVNGKDDDVYIAMIKEHGKIWAIKQYRFHTGSRLRDSKKYIDSLCFGQVEECIS